MEQSWREKAWKTRMSCLSFIGGGNSNKPKLNYCVKSVRIRSYSGPYFSRIFPHSDWIWTETCISPYSVRMWENAGKMRTTITPNTDSFYGVQYKQLYQDNQLNEEHICDEESEERKWRSDWLHWFYLKTTILLLEMVLPYTEALQIL